MINFLYGFSGLVLVVNVALMVVVGRSALYDRRQKVLQFLLVWLLPFFGALICLLVLREAKRKPTIASDEDNPEPSLAGTIH